MKILITGGTDGMGKGVAKILAADDVNHEIIILCRNKEKGEQTVKELKEYSNNQNISIVICDLMKLRDVKNVISSIKEKHEYLDCIFVNAGIGYAPKRVVSEDNIVAHFQVNYLSQFMLTLNLLDLLEKSDNGPRIIFNATESGEIYWNDIQMEYNWSYEKGIHQAMVAKRMFLKKLSRIYANNKISFVGFQIDKVVWTNQINIIPSFMRMMASVMKVFGKFITIEECGKIMLPLFTENKDNIKQRNGKFITWKKNEFIDLKENEVVLDKSNQDKLWEISLELLNDEETRVISQKIEQF